jgi:hypothetical protein
MPSRSNLIFASIILVALVLVLVASGAAPVIVQLLTNIAQAVVSVIRGLIAR